eukprot:Tbor_TRINITY_DN5625_c3_g2::TRINITY_DN5625_c3_g2_i4::g.8118::m.8118
MTTSQEIMTRQMAESDERRDWPFLATIIPIEKEVVMFEKALIEKERVREKQKEAFDGKIEAKTLTTYDALCLNYLTSDDPEDMKRLIYIILNRNTEEERIKLHNLWTFGKIGMFTRTGKEALVLQDLPTPFPQKKYHNINLRMFDEASRKKKGKHSTRYERFFSEETPQISG